MISFDNVTKKYGNNEAAVKSMTMDIREGEFFVIIGPSGCGKTTALKMINRLIPLTEGTLSINGKKISEYNVHELRWNTGYVLQQIALFPHMTIEENVAVVPELKNWSPEKIRARIDELLQMVGLAPNTYRNRKPKELSGGQQQRVGVVRALAADPEIILMDEPFSALDPITREKLQDDMLSLQKKIKKTIVFVTHDMQEALKLGDRICVMKDGEIVQIGTPEEIVQKPVNDFVREFVGVQSQPYLSLEDLAMPVNETISDVSRAISSNASLKETLSLLADDEAVFVEKDGQVIGTINRQRIIQHLAENLQEEGRVNE